MSHPLSDVQRPRPYQYLWPGTARCPLLGFAAWSGTGKTTLLSHVIPLLRARGLRIGLIKHAHHEVEVDQPGKDSHRLRKAGAEQVLLTTSRRWALMTERREESEPELAEELTRLNQEELDLVLVEGFRDQRFPKIELLRQTAKSDRRPMYLTDNAIIALATDGTDPAPTTSLPVLNLNDPPGIADFILHQVLARTETS
ncbi:MAG: molybdopterin-guanine dinucleotide biosynthesis protein B [Ectothiorhodospiraceae bacterium]|nr:molybdopterin-guanine dinucleotide biosynthesis protein B [Ectothiorhodospiraceae bacterium]MCH8503945.1 molybdopterin-guanine dinucleotide biosynthesis protein B [Ectothiorhodospiraceae bacterium]